MCPLAWWYPYYVRGPMRKGIQRLPSGRYPATNENRLLSKGDCVISDHIPVMRAEKMHVVTLAILV
jgi:hypothetical protein